VSVLLALAVMGLLGWAVWAGQFEDMEAEGRRILETEVTADADGVANTEAH
jgi:cbb3-type cytochrome oxidase maturation protein